MDELEKIETVTALETASMDKNAIEIDTEQNSFSKQFKSSLSPKNGYFGETTFTNEYGFTKRIGKTENGSTFHEYYDSNNKLYLKRELNEDSSVTSTYYDDNGLGYLSSSLKVENNVCVLDKKLAQNVTIKKGNFTATTDYLGRPVDNKITDLTIKTEGRESLNRINRTSSYRPRDQKGHLIADKFGGPASEENIVPQLDKVNQSKMAQVENMVRDLKAEGKSVDYEVKTNYSGSKRRPTSFEPKITADGEEIALPKDLTKIYNESDADLTTAKKVKIEAREKFGTANEAGLKAGAVAGGLAFAVSTVENVSLYVDGDITAEDMIIDIVEDTASAGAIGYGTQFISTAVSQAMSKSSSALISKVGNSCLPAAVVAFGVESYDDISAYAKGEIDTQELVYNLGENASGIAGGFVAGAALGSVAGLPGAIIGGVIGCAVSTEIYQTAVEFGAENAEKLAEKSQEFAKDVVNTVAKAAPEAVEEVKSAFTDFAKKVKLPLHF